MARRMVVISLGLGVLYIGNSASYYAALTRVSASLAALIVFTYPAIVAVLSLRFGRRLRGRRAWTALAMTIVGSVLTIGGIPADELPDPGWLVLVAISPIVYSCWIILQAWATGERANRAAGQGDDADDVGAAGAAVTQRPHGQTQGDEGGLPHADAHE